MRFHESCLALTFLAGLAAAQPRDQHRQAGGHGHAHGHYHHVAKAQKSGRITVTDPSVSEATLVPEVVVYIDKHGKPHKTSKELVLLVPATKKSPHATSTSVPLPLGVATSVAPAIQVDASGKATAVQPPPAASTSTGLPSNITDVKDDGGSGLFGVTYSPYASDGSCKTAGQVLSDFQQLKGQYAKVRIYGVDCDQVNTVMQAANSINVKLMLGIFNLDGLDGEVGTLISAVKANGGWAPIEAVSVGNELVNNGQATPAQVIGAVNSARRSLRAAGYQGPVVTVDTFVAVQRNPSLCDNSDFCAMNIHPFFDPNTPSSNAGDFVARQVANTRQVLQNPDQRIVVTESGWPWQGSANGEAVPGKDNQRVAVESIRNTYGAANPNNLFLFTAFNDGWKKAEAPTFYAEQFWGMDQAS